MTKVDVWMPIYIGDYLASTSRLTTEQHGAYLLLIMDYWKNGPPPDDDAVLAQICRMGPDSWARSRVLIVSFFDSVDGNLIHQRIERERGKAVVNTEAKSKSGALGAASKWGSLGNENNLKRSERLANARRLGTHSSGEWEALKQLCGDSCLRCGDVSQLVKDHITPIYQGGSDAISNIQPLCKSCNSSKGADCTDHRPSDWQESMAKRLANAYLMPAPSPSPSKPSSSLRSEEGSAEKSPRFSAQKWLESKGVPKQVAGDWIKLRKAKRLESTLTALQGVEVEAAKAGHPLSAVIEECAKNSWAGFKASWDHGLGGAGGAKSGLWFMSSTGIEAKAAELGVAKAAGEFFPSFKARVYQAAGVTEDMVRRAKIDAGEKV